MIPLVLNWFVKHCGPPDDPQAILECLQPILIARTTARAPTPSAAYAIAAFLKSQGATISDTDMYTYQVISRTGTW